MSAIHFPDAFHALTGSSPFPWQTALYAEFTAGRVPAAANIPTGLGKTSIVAIWLIALAQHPDRVPRRLVYVVNRRTVVDQTTAEATKWRTRLQTDPRIRDLRDSLASLRAIPSAASVNSEDDSPLAISTLRGQFADNREWSADPARPALIIGTVDMIGSGLLFSRYTVGFKLRPHHAALLAQDALLVHDEAHLEPAFKKLLESIADAQSASADPRKLRIIALTATSRGSSDSAPPFGLTDEDKMSRPEDGVETNIVLRRYHATKRLQLASVEADKDLRAKIVRRASEKKESGRAVLIFVRSVDMAEKIAAELGHELGKGGAAKVATLTGTMRGKERDDLVTGDSAAARVFRRFLPSGETASDSGPTVDAVFLVATSAGEVGVNISADDLICDLSTYESIAQRFGRVNRFGHRSDSMITVVHAQDMQAKYDAGLAKAKSAPKDVEKKVQAYEDKNKIDLVRLRTLELLRQLAVLKNGEGDASPAALDTLPAAARAAAFSPLPEMRVATAIQFDAWALTSIREPIAARPPVAPYLHGEDEWEPPQTHVAWREEVDKIKGSTLLENYSPEDLLEDFPLKPHELLRDTTGRIFDRLLIIIENLQEKASPIPVAWLVHEEGKVEVFSLAGLLADDAPDADGTEDDEAENDDTASTNNFKAEKDAAKRRKERFVARLADRTLILPPSLGGLSPQGFLSSDADASSPVRVFDALPPATGRLPDRKRVSSATPTLAAGDATGYRLVRIIDTGLASEALPTARTGDADDPADEETSSGDVKRYWLWLEAKNVVGTERRFSANADHPETLAAHTQAVEGHARAITAKLLSIPLVGEPDLARCLILAATLHDLGKNRRQWQRGIGNLDYDPANPDTIFAKSGGKLRPRILAEHYRHEFGSLVDAMTDAKIISELATLTDLERDIVLQLVAAHHGRARPHFPADEILDYSPTTSPDQATLIATEVPRRFARLQRRFGRWGLAWLESLLRAADYAASAGIVPQFSAPISVESATPSQTKPSPNTRPPALTATLSVNPANPGHYFACCGLFELAACVSPEALAWFEQDAATSQWSFHLANTPPLKELLAKITAAEIKCLDTVDNHSAIEVGLPRLLRLDWWRNEKRITGKLKTWAGRQGAFKILTALRDEVANALLTNSALNLVDLEATPSTAVSYFDAPRSTNAAARDVGFSMDKLKDGGVVFQNVLHPAVEFFSLVGLQRTRPTLLPRQLRAEQAYAYQTWLYPIPVTLLPVAAIGRLPDCSRTHYRFMNPSRTKDYLAFTSANIISAT